MVYSEIKFYLLSDELQTNIIKYQLWIADFSNQNPKFYEK